MEFHVGQSFPVTVKWNSSCHYFLPLADMLLALDMKKYSLFLFGALPCFDFLLAGFPYCAAYT